MPFTDTSVDTGDDSIRASLMAAYDAPEPDSEVAPSDLASQVEPAQDAATTAASTAAETLPEPVAASTSKEDHPTDKTRYADGSFKPKAAPEKAAATDSPSKDTQTQASAVAQTTVAPPAGWTAAEKASWATLPPAVQAAVSRREAEMATGGQRWSEEKRRYEAMIAPVAESARARGMDAATGLQTLIAAQRALDTNPLDAIKHIARSYGVDLATLAGTQAADGSREANPQPTQQPAVYRDPRVDQLWQSQQAQEQQRQQQTVDFVTQFATTAGHEHFDAVQDELMAMIPSIKATNPVWSHDKILQEAYDRATYANPTTRAAILAANEAAGEQKRIEAAKQRTNAARRASSSVTGAPSGVPATVAKDSLRAEIEAAFAGG